MRKNIKENDVTIFVGARNSLVCPCCDKSLAVFSLESLLLKKKCPRCNSALNFKLLDVSFEEVENEKIAI